MKMHPLQAEKRDILGKKVKGLRKKGMLPGNIYGKSVKSTAVSLNLSDFTKTYSETGETGLIELTIKGGKTPHHVLVHNVQIHAVSGDYIHADLHEVALKEKIIVPVPLTFEGESPAAAQKKGVLITLVNELEVEALPTDLPEEIVVSLVNLKEIGDEIKVSDIKTPKNVRITEDGATVVARINPLEKEEEPAPAPAAAEPIEGTEDPEGEVKPEPAPSESPKTEKKKE